MPLTAIVVAPPHRAEFARQGLLSAFLDTRNGRLKPLAQPEGAAQLAEAPLAAYKVRVDEADPTVSRRALALMFAGEPVDWCVCEGDAPRPRVLISDMDSTLVRCESLDELADALGFGEPVSAITEKAMRGELDFAGALRERAALLKGAPAEMLETVWTERIQPNIARGAATLVATLKAHGAYTALVTGGFSYFAARLATLIGMDTVQANELKVSRGRITGDVKRPIRDGAAKQTMLSDLAFSHGEGPEDTIALGDGANDIPMLEAAGLSIGVDPKPVLAKVAHGRVLSGDLRAVLLFLGIPPKNWTDLER